MQRNQVHFFLVLLSSCMTLQKLLASFPGQRTETRTFFTSTYLWDTNMQELMLDILLQLWGSLVYWRELEKSIQPFLKNIQRVETQWQTDKQNHLLLPQQVLLGNRSMYPVQWRAPHVYHWDKVVCDIHNCQIFAEPVFLMYGVRSCLSSSRSIKQAVVNCRLLLLLFFLGALCSFKFSGS